MPGPVSDSYEGPSDDVPEIPAWALPSKETERERRYRQALEKLRDGIFFLDRREMKSVIDEALKTG